MVEGFPRSALPLLRCPDDRGALALSTSDESPTRVREGSLSCATCRAVFPIRDGIVRILDRKTLHEESERERTTRDELWGSSDASWERSEWSRADVDPTIDALELRPGASVLEIGCGAGRMTAIMAERGARVLAVDLSLGGLNAIAARSAPGWDVALVQADCTRFSVKDGAFDGALSTLVSNLPSLAHRKAMYRLVAGALAPGGRFVFSTHHYRWLDRLRKVPQSGHYPENGIYRYFFRRKEARAEAGEFFRRVRAWPIQFHFSFLPRFGAVRLSRVLEHVPVVNQTFGTILLLVATQPISGTGVAT